jgi:hypothetical protein
MIYGCELITAEHGIQVMYASVPEKVLRLLLQTKLLPKQLTVRSHRLAELLQPLRSELKIQLKYSPELPAVEAAAEALFEQMARQ